MRFALFAIALFAQAQTAPPRQVSGVYPHLALFNGGSECGTGAVVPWAGRLWVLTYSPHSPFGSDDKLYEIDEQLNKKTRPESIGGTPANRMIHRESNQLFIGPYAIDGEGKVRAIPYKAMPGRPTGNARHLTDPANKIYYASMEEGFYEVDVRTLAVRQLYEDANVPAAKKDSQDLSGPLLPGYHGKGFYSGQGRVVYANNGEVGGGSLPPDTPSGCLAEWNGKDWRVVKRNQFTEVTGPGGIYGNANAASDPVWAVGWDHRSIMLMTLENGKWQSWRLPKAAHTYDGAHGWNTEWPRIREIGESDLLMTMHGTFWRFPKTFGVGRSAGIAPRSTYLRVIGDFARWRDRIVFGSDDTALSEFLNTRRVKGKIAGPGQSQSNLWFMEPSRLDRLGAPIGHGGVWVKDDVKAGEASDPYLFAGYERRMLHLAHAGEAAATFTLEVDRAGDGKWSKLSEVSVGPRGYKYVIFDAQQRGAWIRVKASSDVRGATAFFEYSNRDLRTEKAAGIFDGLARAGAGGAKGSAGWVWARGENRGTLLFASGEELYEMNAGLEMKAADEPEKLTWMKQNLAPPDKALEVDAASAIYTDEKGKRWRLPKGDASFDRVTGGVRVAREASTERDLLNVHGTFYELPSNNAGGIAMVRPIATHNLDIRDWCSWRGLLVLSGVAGAGERVVRAASGKGALWLGISDDLWQLGKPRGEGGPWNATAVKAGVPSDPYLMTGYDRKTLRLSGKPVKVRVEVDITGNGLWMPYATLDAPAVHEFPEGFSAYWVRTVALADATLTATLTYR